MNTETKDPALWKIAKKRAGFKYNLFGYIIMTLFFWVLWFIGRGNNIAGEESLLPWPFWPTLMWGIGVVYNYMEAYMPGNLLAEKEYKKLEYKP
jgi:2TM domain